MKDNKVYLYGVIGYDWWTDTDNTAQRFIQDLNTAAESNDRVEVRVNSVGGDVHEGLAIMSAIRDCKVPVDGFNDGVAYSMAGPILISCDNVKMASNALFMAHSASTFAWGNAIELREQADILDKYDDSLADAFAKRLDISKDDVKAKYFDGKDHFYTADEALEEGFIDEILENVSSKLPENIRDMAPLQVAAILSKPNPNNSKPAKPGMLNRAGQAIKDFFTPHQDNSNPNNQESMKVTSKFVALVAALGLAFRENEDSREIEVTDEVTQKINDAFASKDAELDSLRSQVSDLTTDRDNLQTKVTDLEGQAPPPSNGGNQQDPPRDGGEQKSWDTAEHNAKYAKFIGSKSSNQ